MRCRRRHPQCARPDPAKVQFRGFSVAVVSLSLSLARCTRMRISRLPRMRRRRVCWSSLNVKCVDVPVLGCWPYKPPPSHMGWLPYWRHCAFDHRRPCIRTQGWSAQHPTFTGFVIRTRPCSCRGGCLSYAHPTPFWHACTPAMMTTVQSQ